MNTLAVPSQDLLRVAVDRDARSSNFQRVLSESSKVIPNSKCCAPRSATIRHTLVLLLRVLWLTGKEKIIRIAFSSCSFQPCSDRSPEGRQSRGGCNTWFLHALCAYMSMCAFAYKCACLCVGGSFRLNRRLRRPGHGADVGAGSATALCPRPTFHSARRQPIHKVAWHPPRCIGHLWRVEPSASPRAC